MPLGSKLCSRKIISWGGVSIRTSSLDQGGRPDAAEAGEPFLPRAHGDGGFQLRSQSIRRPERTAATFGVTANLEFTNGDFTRQQIRFGNQTFQLVDTYQVGVPLFTTHTIPIERCHAQYDKSV